MSLVKAEARAPRGVFVGLATLDLIYRVAATPGANEKVTARDLLVQAGGPAANAAVAFSAVGGQAVLVTALGQHPLARTVIDELAHHGVECVDATPDHAGLPPMSSVLVTTRTGERAVVSGSAVHRDVPWLDVAPWLRGADALLVDGHHARLARAAVDTAAGAGVPVVVDAGSWRSVFAELIPRAAFVLCSADLRLPGTSPEATLDGLLARGAIVAGRSDGGRPVEWQTTTRRGVVEVPTVQPVDTAGAGDVLHGAVAYGVARLGVTVPALERWLPWAVEVASVSCMHPGTRAWTRNTLPAFPS